MLTRVCALEEICSSIPISKEHPRRFKIDCKNLLLVDFEKVSVARTFEANVIWPGEMTDGKGEIELSVILVEMFFPGGLDVITLMDGEIELGLRGFNEIYNEDDEEDEDDEDDGEVTYDEGADDKD